MVGQLNSITSFLRIYLLLILYITFNYAQIEQWIYRYNGLYNAEDEAHSIVYGSDSNLYVVGHSKNSSWEDDFTVLSLGLNGSERWVYQYHTPGSTSDIARSVAYGSDGNIYVAGHSHSWSFDDLLVVSLDQNGTERWIYRSDSTVSFWDEGSSIIYGSENNLYVVGRSNVHGSLGDFTVLSLDTAGNERWIYRYNGLGNHWDWAESIVYGLDGNLYAAGRSWGRDDEDFTVISLDTNGDERWVYIYNRLPANMVDRAHSIVYGSDGNLYVAGTSENDTLNGVFTHSDFTVISLDANGNERWIYHYNGPANWFDGATSITYSSSGSIYAVGWSYGIGTNYDFTVISLNQSGADRWIYRYNGPGNYKDFADCVIYGLDGNIYAVGRSFGIGTNYDFTVISLNQSGADRWIYRYNGSGNIGDWAWSAAYGSDGNLYVAGLTSDSVTGKDFTVVSLDPITGVAEQEFFQRISTALQISPNPFSDRIAIRFQIEDDRYKNVGQGFSLANSEPEGLPKICIYDASGRLVKDFLLPTAYSLLPTEISWNGVDNAGQKLPCGVYFLEFKVGDCTETMKLLLIR